MEANRISSAARSGNLDRFDPDRISSGYIASRIPGAAMEFIMTLLFFNNSNGKQRVGPRLETLFHGLSLSAATLFTLRGFLPVEQNVLCCTVAAFRPSH